VLVWWLLRNKLPTRDNLVRRHIIAHDSQFCVTGYEGAETVYHLFFSCQFFASLWCLIRDWCFDVMTHGLFYVLFGTPCVDQDLLLV
jgi:hypothetical protein